MSTFADITQFLANNTMVTGSMRSALNGGFLYLYSGPVPATADAAIDGSGDMLMKLTESDDGSTGLTFQASATNGVLRKTTAEVWKGTCTTAGTATFFRFCTSTDDGTGASSGTQPRVQGTVGTDMTYGMILTNPVFALTDQLTLTDFQLALPQVQP